MSEPGYIQTARAAYPKTPEVDLEFMFASDRSFREISGLSAHRHRRRAMELLWPERVWHDWREERIASVQHCMDKRIKELMWIGSSNSNKTGDLADIVLDLWWQKPEMTTVYVTSPYESATETGVWAEIVLQFSAAKDRHPHLPGRLKTSDCSIVLYDRSPKSFIRVATVDQVGKLVGRKSRSFEEGMLIVVADELPAFSASASRSFTSVMKNLWSVPNMLLIGAGNFALIGDALGIFCDPDEADIARGYDGFNPDKHYRWRTKRKGLCLRFDGLQSPNVKAGKDLYPFVTTLEYIATMASQPGGLESPDAMRYVRSAPVFSSDDKTVTNSERVRVGGGYDPYEWTGEDIKLLAFCDAGLGGDPCVIQKFKLGWERTPGGARRQILALWEMPYIVPIRIGATDEDGEELTVEDQVGLGMKKYAEKYGIVPRHFGYDAAMRPALAGRIAKRYSVDAVPIDSNGPPTERRVSTAEKGATWKEKVDRIVTEYWFATAGVIDSRQMRGLELSPKGVAQLCSRRWEFSGNRKKRLDTKLEYREMLKAQGKAPESPNEADAICGGVELARRLGLKVDGFKADTTTVQRMLDLIAQRKMERYKSEVFGGVSALPRGSLHGMRPPQTGRQGRLNSHRQ